MFRVSAMIGLFLFCGILFADEKVNEKSHRVSSSLRSESYIIRPTVAKTGRHKTQRFKTPPPLLIDSVKVATWNQWTATARPSHRMGSGQFVKPIPFQVIEFRQGKDLIAVIKVDSNGHANLIAEYLKESPYEWELQLGEKTQERTFLQKDPHIFVEDFNPVRLKCRHPNCKYGISLKSLVNK